MFTYSINIAKFSTGPAPFRHMCKVEIPSHSTEEYALEVFAQMERAFPLPQFKLTLTKWSVPMGQTIAESL